MSLGAGHSILMSALHYCVDILYTYCIYKRILLAISAGIKFTLSAAAALSDTFSRESMSPTCKINQCLHPLHSQIYKSSFAIYCSWDLVAYVMYSVDIQPALC